MENANKLLLIIKKQNTIHIVGEMMVKYSVFHSKPKIQLNNFYKEIFEIFNRNTKLGII
jgi:hypothetical protein